MSIFIWNLYILIRWSLIVLFLNIIIPCMIVSMPLIVETFSFIMFWKIISIKNIFNVVVKKDNKLLFLFLFFTSESLLHGFIEKMMDFFHHESFCKIIARIILYSIFLINIIPGKEVWMMMLPISLLAWASIGIDTVFNKQQQKSLHNL